jgi:DNA-binding beta-propeller fold protein YncE
VTTLIARPAVTIEAGERTYELVAGWGQLPEGWRWGQVAGVACDSEDNVHVYSRTEHPYMVFDKDGKLLDHWGEGIFPTAHSLYIDRHDSMFVLSHSSHLILKFNRDGKHVLTLGKRDQASDTGYTKEGRVPASPWLSGSGLPVTNGVAYGGPPFNQPTDVAVAADGTIFVSDGYRNARFHKFSATGELLGSWGEPGNAQDLRNSPNDPGKFHTPHGIWVEGDRVYVLDRENNRIQIFSLDGAFQGMWTMLERPTDMYVDRQGVAYVSELEDHVSILDLDGNVIGRFGSERSNAPGKFWGPHCIWADSSGDLYVGEVLEGQRLQKFARVR